MSLVTLKDVSMMSDKEVFTSYVLVKSYGIKPTKTGGKYIEGLIEMKGSIPFKVWSGPLFDDLDKYDYENSICQVDAEVNVFGGSKSLIIKKMAVVENTGFSESDFFKEKYETEKFFNGFLVTLKNECSPEALGVLELIFDDTVLSRFQVEFAASRHHDAVKSGLLVHTYRVMFFMSKIAKLYPEIVKKCSMDLLMIGCAVHDIGKIYEYTNGTVIGNGVLVSHHTFAVELLTSKKSSIIKITSEDFYYRLLAIVEQHHGEYGEKPRTIEAYLIFLIDNLEAKFQSVQESLESGLSCVMVDGYKLN